VRHARWCHGANRNPTGTARSDFMLSPPSPDRPINPIPDATARAIVRAESSGAAFQSPALVLPDVLLDATTETPWRFVGDARDIAIVLDEAVANRAYNQP
jgi:hypothetical protein